jgi:tetratricopeptide (TPR) repeat protein
MDYQPRLAEGAPKIDDLKAALEADPKDSEAASRLGWELYGLRDFEGAAEALDTAHKLAPDDPEIAYGLGLSLKQLRENDRAIKAFKVAVKHADRVENNLRAAMLRRMGDAQISFLESGDWHMEPPA